MDAGRGNGPGYRSLCIAGNRSAYRRLSAFAIPNGTGETRRKGIFSTVSHPDGGFASTAREHPEANIDMPFLVGTVPYARELAAAFRVAGRPVIYVAHVHLDRQA
jgi:hypothetical protein